LGTPGWAPAMGDLVDVMGSLGAQGLGSPGTPGQGGVGALNLGRLGDPGLLCNRAGRLELSGGLGVQDLGGSGDPSLNPNWGGTHAANGVALEHIGDPGMEGGARLALGTHWGPRAVLHVGPPPRRRSPKSVGPLPLSVFWGHWGCAPGARCHCSLSKCPSASCPAGELASHARPLPAGRPHAPRSP
jgi:hypothetical protein